MTGDGITVRYIIPKPATLQLRPTHAVESEGVCWLFYSVEPARLMARVYAGLHGEATFITLHRPVCFTGFLE